MAYELAKERINILDIHPLRDNYYAVAFEYQYLNRDRSRVWQKNVAVISADPEQLLDVTVPVVLKYVKNARLDLER